MAHIEDKVRKEAPSAWAKIKESVIECDLDAIEESVKLLRRYQMIMNREPN